MRSWSVALGALLLIAATCAVDAAPISLREVRQGLFGTCFASDRDGWMVGELGRIFHTTDGGDTWERQDAGTKRPLLAVSCLDARTAWIAGKEGIVYGTTDAGATWTEAKTGSSRHVFSLQFAGRDRGHGAGDFGTIVTLLAFTAQRRGEIAALHSSWINRGAMFLTIPKDVAKNGHEHQVPLTPAVLALLPYNEGLLFPARGAPNKHFNGWSKSMQSFRKACNIEGEG